MPSLRELREDLRGRERERGAGRRGAPLPRAPLGAAGPGRLGAAHSVPGVSRCGSAVRCGRCGEAGAWIQNQLIGQKRAGEAGAGALGASRLLPPASCTAGDRGRCTTALGRMEPPRRPFGPGKNKWQRLVQSRDPAPGPRAPRDSTSASVGHLVGWSRAGSA